MKTTLNVCTLFFCAFFSLHSAAQAWQPGFIITTKGDSLHGFISYRDARLNPRVIDFYASDVKDALKINPRDINGFTVNGEQPYISFRGIVNTDPIELDKLLYSNDRHFNDENKKADTVFLRVLATGQIKLYELEDFKYHYFIQYNEGAVVELLNKFYMMPGPPEYKVNNRIYIHQVDSLLAANRITGEAIDLQSISYNKEDLVKLVNQLNGFHGSNAVVAKVYKTKAKQNRFGMGGGISWVQFRQNDAPYHKIKTMGAGGLIHVYYDFTGLATLNKIFGRIALQGQTFSCHANQNQKEKKGENTQTLTNIGFIPSVNYTFIKNSAFEVYAGVAPCVNINLSNTSAKWSFTYTQFDANGAPVNVFLASEEHPVKKVWANVNMQAGLILQKKWDFNVSYDFLNTPEEAVISGASPGFTVNMLSIKLNYLFGL